MARNRPPGCSIRGGTPELFAVSNQLEQGRRAWDASPMLEARRDSLVPLCLVVQPRVPLNELRFALLHGEQVTPRIVERMKRLGMGLLIQDRQLLASDTMKLNWGDRAKDAPALRMVLESGLPMAGGTDGTIAAAFRPFMSLWWFVSGKNWRGEVVRPTQKLTREEALRVYTRNGAWFTFDEGRRGQLTPGFLADLIVLDRDYLTVPEDDIRFIRPTLTVVGGNVVYEAGR